MDETAAAEAIATLGGETMGTTWSVRLNAARDADLHALHAGIELQLAGIVRQMSTWEAGSDISRYNRAAPGSWHPMAPEFRQVLDCALEVAGASDGAFDPSVGPLVGLWGFGAHARRDLPAAGDLQEARLQVDWRRVQIDQTRGQLFQPGGLQLDFSAIAKGFGVDAVGAHLRDAGISGALVEVGGELYGFGARPDGQPWRVLVEAGPEEEDHDLEPRILVLNRLAVASSGDRWHHYQRDGRRYTHTIDPRLGEPGLHAPAAVTVLAEEAMRADAWATALTVLGADAGLELATRLGLAARFLDRTVDGLRERMTDGFRRHLAA